MAVTSVCFLSLLWVSSLLSEVGADEYRNDWFVKRLLSSLQHSGPGQRGLAEAFSCRKLGEKCRSLPKCCESMTCFHRAGFRLGKDGVCVKCIAESEKCQRDDQCCSNLQCDRGNALWIDGTCKRYRRSGSCYRDGQCVKACVKQWYDTHGTCT